MEKYFESKSKLVEYLIQEMWFEEDAAEDCFDELEDRKEEPHKRTTRISGYILDTNTGYYYQLYWDWDYDYGAADFHFDTNPLQMKEEVQTITVKKFVPIDKE